MNDQFVHLRLHSEFSLVDGMVRIKPLISRVRELGMPAVAITDQTNLFALVKFYRAALAAGIKPIVGADLLVIEDDGDVEDAAPICLLVQNRVGYQNLIQLISRAYTDGQSRGKSLLKKQWLREHAEGLIALSCGREGAIGQSLVAGKSDRAEQQLREWSEIFPDRFYLELHRTGREHEEDYLHAAVALAGRCDCPVVATNDVRFIKEEDFEAHEARVCIHDGRTLNDPRRPRRYSAQQYLRSAEEMVELFADIPEALANSVEIARRCNIDIELGKNYLPDFPTPEGKTIDDLLRDLSREGLQQRLESLLDPDESDYAARRKEYEERLEFELDVIIQMGFPGYFLIVMDFIRWAKNNGVPVGPGRGSGAGSLVAYVLGITDLDPLAYDLLFERFLNPERVSMPDFDVDFCMDGRDRVIAYVAETYGRDAVSQIITFGTMAAKAVVRDVARVQGKPYGLADKLSKMIPFEPGMTLNKALEQEEPLRQFVEENDEVSEIMDMAFKLEGITRNVGKHAGGVVIAPTRLTDFSPLYCDDSGGSLVTQFDKDDVEQAGLVKFDFLGLRTLTIIDWAVDMVNARREKSGEAALDVNTLPMDDAAAFDLMKRGETTAVFQLESRGMKDLIKRLRPDCFEDIVALVALFRPGPLESGMVGDFIDRKKGIQPVAYPHPKYQHEDLKPILEPTYGIILYQEQVMQIAQVLGGYTLGGADLLRRAMGKKKPEEMAKQRQIFMHGALEKGVDEELAGNIFDLMEKFAGYGFNKSHSAAYALVSYQTAWLKAHYPAEFMAAVLTADMQNTDKIVTLVEECRSMELPLVLPDINQSAFRFTVDDQGRIIYGLGAVKGLGEGPIESIMAGREQGGPYTDIFDFCQRVDSRKVNKRVLEALIRCGAFDSLGVERAVLMFAMPEAVKAAEQQARNADSGMTDLFGAVSPCTEEDVYADFHRANPWSVKELLRGERDTLGLYVSGHPIDEYERELAHFVKKRLVELRPEQSRLVAGLIVDARTMKTKRGDTMAIITLDDRTARIEVAVFSDVYEQCREALLKDNVVVVSGDVSPDDFTGSLKMRAKTVMGLAQARLKYARQLVLKLGQGDFSTNFSHSFHKLVGQVRGRGCKVKVEYTGRGASASVYLGDEWKIPPNDENLQRLREFYGEDRVYLQYDSAG
jgi:DNA polymerase-3 subunit alpha